MTENNDNIQNGGESPLPSGAELDLTALFKGDSWEGFLAGKERADNLIQEKGKLLLGHEEESVRKVLKDDDYSQWLIMGASNSNILTELVMQRSSFWKNG